MILRKEGFEPWRCDRTYQMGIHLEHLNKVLKCMGAKDSSHGDVTARTKWEFILSI